MADADAATAQAWVTACFASNISKAYVYSDYVAIRVRKVNSLPEGKTTVVVPAGLSWNNVGVAFAPGWNFVHPFQMNVLDPLLLALGGSYSLPLITSDFKTPSDLIAPTKFPGAKKSKELKRLMRDGFARIDRSWGLAPFLTPDVRRVLSSRLTKVAQVRGRDDVPVSTLELPELKAGLLPALLPRLTELARSYLGEDAELYLNGGTPEKGSPVLASRLPTHFGNDWSQRYPSGDWHHDRCGKRLKAWVFLQSVGLGDHPTEIAVGSHKTLYWAHDSVHMSRYTRAYVESEYTTHAFTGEVGEGFIFDTNAMHRATIPGNGSREALVIEFNPSQKSKLLFRSPCGYDVHGDFKKYKKMSKEMLTNKDVTGSELAAKFEASMSSLQYPQGKPKSSKQRLQLDRTADALRKALSVQSPWGKTKS